MKTEMIENEIVASLKGVPGTFYLWITNIASVPDPVTPRAETPVSPRKRHNEKSKSTKQDLDEFVTHGVSEWFKDGCFSPNPIKSFEWYYVIHG